MYLSLCLFFLFLFFFTLFDYFNVDKIIRNFLLFVSCSFLFLFVTFRFNVPDYDSYVEIFNEVSNVFNLNNNNELHGEFGFLVLNYLIKTLGGNPKTLFAIVSIISISLSVVFYKKYTNFYLISLLVYFSHIFLLREMIQIRSGLAIAICMFAIPYVEKRRFLYFLFFVGLASSFHTICILFVLVYLVYPYLKDTKKLILFIFSGIILGLFLNLKYIEKIFLFTGAPSLVIGYLFDDNYNFTLGLLNPVLIKNLVVISILIYNKNFFISRIKYFEVLLVCYAISVFWLSCFNSFAIFSSRIATLFSNVEHVLIPSILLIEKYKLVVYIFIIIYCFLSFLSKFSMIQNWSFNF
jgi:hypothetical protein